MTLDARELLRRVQAGETDRAVARELGVARKTVARYREFARQEGFLEGPLPEPAELDRRLRPMVAHTALPRQPFKAAAFREQIDGLLAQGVETQAMFQRLRSGWKYPGSYSGLRRYVLHIQGAAPSGFVRIEVDPGAEAQVDFGYAGRLVDPKTGELRKAWAFVMTLSHSRHQYATLVFDQAVETWLRCHREAFEHFGGVAKKIVLDNLKAGIIRVVMHDPVAQRSYRELAEHYGFLISPCRPRTPRHKGKVESGVHYVKRNFLAGRSFRDLTEANAQLLVWVETVAGARCHGTTKEAPLVRFARAERAALAPLPPSPYDLGVWKKVKLHPDCHVVVGGAYYSAPHRLIGRQLWVRSNHRDVVIFHDYERIASHAWGPPGTRRTQEIHYPPHKAAFLMATPRYCQHRAESIGPFTKDLVERLLGERPMDRLRTAQAVLRLSGKYGPQRLEAACRRALCYGDTAYGTLKRILEKGLEAGPLPDIMFPAEEKQSFAFARPGSEIFPLLKEQQQGGTDHGR